ncbi:tetraspanin-8 [Fundulus heteroclitus]|uniref:tetraspanin-8 n=1 Tax=Fundulus heteroclitus TaxID=8078 RepID=UPI00165A3891|nr:tetraspanin-8 [Fundulus heteroclitus]
MGKLNICLKWSFICVIVVIALISLLLLGSALLLHGALLNREEEDGAIVGVLFLYGFTTITLVLVIFGGIGALKKMKWALIVFAVGMIISVLYMVGSEITMQVMKTELRNHLRDHYLTSLSPSKANESSLGILHHAQSNWHCCGLEQGYMDWENNIPESCLCDRESTNQCVAAPKGSYQFTVERGMKGQSVMIYARPCLSTIIENNMYHINILSGIRVGFILLWMLSIGLCIAILCQENKKLETPAVVYSKEAKAGNYSCLIESEHV